MAEIIDPGRFKDRITLQKKVETEGPVQPLDEYEDYKIIWADARYLTGRTLYAARAASVETDIELIIRRRSDIDESMRIRYDNRIFEIEGILPLGKDKKYFTIKAKEVKYDM